MFLAKLQIDMFTRVGRARDRILRDDAAVVLDFHLKPIVRQNPIAELEDLRERPRVQTMIDVISNIRLEQAGVGRVMQPAAAIDESLGDVSKTSVMWKCAGI